MSDIATTLKECHAIVWRYRAELEPYWPTPSTGDALLFAFTELGEAVDAHLRSKPEYARNRDKDLSVLDELADCAMMLLTALPNVSDVWQYERIRTAPEWGCVAKHIGLAMDLQPTKWDWEHDVYISIIWITRYPGMDLPARLTSRLERIKAKRLPQQEVA